MPPTPGVLSALGFLYSDVKNEFAQTFVRTIDDADRSQIGDILTKLGRDARAWQREEFLGSLETDVFEVAPGHYIHVEQHRHAQDHVYKMGDRETLYWHAESGVLLENSRRPDEVEAV